VNIFFRKPCKVIQEYIIQRFFVLFLTEGIL